MKEELYLPLLTRPVSQPKAQAGKRTVTVGEAGSDFVGFTGTVIQQAVNALRNCGGTVVLSAGIFSLRVPVELYSDITLCGQGEKTVLKKEAGARSFMRRDADYGELAIAVTDPTGFQVGDGVLIFDDANPYGWHTTPSRIAEIRGDLLYIEDYLLRDYRADKNGTVTAACSLIEGIDVDRVTVRDFVLDGNRAENDLMDGCRGGAVYFYRSTDICIENLCVRDFNGEGISCQTMLGFTVRGCEVYGCTGDGIHPGTGNYHPLVEDCFSHDNEKDGLFICWRVIGGTFRRNRLVANGHSGINIGHKDTDNVFTENLLADNAAYGLHLRPECPDNAPHRCVFSGNRVANNGLGPVKIESAAEDLVFAENEGI